MLEAVLIAGVYIATVIGAGFASGSELVSYFVKYGRISFFGLVLAAGMFGLLAAIITNRVRMTGVSDFYGYLDIIMPKLLAGLYRKLTALFMLVVFIAMASGMGEALGDFFDISKSWGVLLLCLICYFVFRYNLKGLMAANGALSALIIAGIVGVCWYILNYRETRVFSSFSRITDNWVTAGASYVSYNILTAGVILAEMGRGMKKKQSSMVGVLSGTAIFGLLLCLWVVINVYYGKIPLGSIPMMTICKRQGTALSIIYMVVLFAAMLTTALSNGYAVAQRLSQIVDKRIAVAIVLCLGYFGAGFSFATFVDVIYRILGYLGAILVIFVLADGIKMKKTENIRKQEKIEVI